MTENNYPTYANKADELDELMNFWKFSYKPSSGYNGTCLFELTDEESDECMIRCVRCEKETGQVTVWNEEPPDGKVSCRVTMPFSLFHDVFWGVVGPQALVMGGQATVHNWAYREALAFGCAFDLSSENWVKYYAFKDAAESQLEHNTNSPPDFNAIFEKQISLALKPLQHVMNVSHNKHVHSSNNNNNNNNNNNENDSGRLRPQWNIEMMGLKRCCNDLTTYRHANSDNNDTRIEQKFEQIEHVPLTQLTEGVRDWMQRAERGVSSVSNYLNEMDTRHLSQFMQHCYCYVSGFNLEDNYLSVTRRNSNNAINSINANETGSFYAMDHESTRHLSPIKWKKSQGTAMARNEFDMNINGMHGMNGMNGMNGFGWNRSQQQAQQPQLLSVSYLLNYPKSSEFKNKMESFVNKYKSLKFVSQSMENLYYYGNDKGNIMLDTMLL